MISFAEAHPELVQEWSDSNGDYKPEKISYGSNHKITWIGKCGHQWEAIVKNRSNGSGCPYCAGNQVLYGFNDLASVYPELAAEWSERNYPLIPTAVTVKANRRVWWKCSNCGQCWQARIADRTDGHGCPVCAGEKLVEGINDFATEHPELAEEWATENFDLQPSMVSSKSRKNVWWKCKICGYLWKGVIDSRVKGQKCPACEERIVKKGYNDLQTLYPELADEWHTENNGCLMPDMVSPKSHKDVYWKGPCGHIWVRKINEMAAGAGCPVCEDLFRSEVRMQIVRYYAREAGIEFSEHDTDTIGIPIQIYFPKQRTAIEFSKATEYQGKQKRWENAKNWLCLNSGIRLIRILSPGAKEFNNCICITRTDETYDVLEAAISMAFKVGGIAAEIDLGRDFTKICEGMDKGLLDRRSRSGLEEKWNL
jgi:hypothetical protein